jgi:predicted alpha-1,6-mannanase (GH76 family)
LSADSVAINPALAAEGAAIAADMGRKAQLQFWEDLIADALFEHETGIVSHRRQAEAVLASLLQHGAIR